ncbi:MAG: SMP-30/gluconolactonase/LRE family protein [Pseudomonadales bacterium]
MNKNIFLLPAIALLIACGSNDEPNATNNPGETAQNAATACVSGGQIEVYCGFENPEDLVITPDGKQLIVSEMGEFMVHGPSGLALLDLSSGARAELSTDWQDRSVNWGDVNCPAPQVELFSPHGIDLVQRQDGAQQLLVVNHGGRESVEFFQLTQNSEGNWHTIWRGCALPPDDPFINDVAGLNDGGFIVTHMWNKSLPFAAVVAQLLAGANTGWAYEWQPESGFAVIPGSVQNMPNGVAVNADNSKIFMNVYIGNKTVRIDRASGEVDGEFAVQQPDNITIDENGDIWVASHRHDPINQTCTEPGVCLLPFAVVKADPLSLETETVLEHEGAPMGYSTVALKVGEEIFMGSAHGDRIASFAIESGAGQ